MSGPRASASQRGSVSESESMSIGGSFDSVDTLGLRGSRAKRVIYEASELDDSDAHSELDVDLYDTDEVFEVGRSTSYRISLGSDGFESILSAPSSPQEGDFTLERGVRRADHAFDSFVSVDRASDLDEFREPPSWRPGLQPPHDGASPYDVIHAQALEALPYSMNPALLAVLLGLGFALGLALRSMEPPAELGFWLERLGHLYVRLVGCTAVPLGVCQVLFSVATLTPRRSLWRLWLKTLGFFLLLALLALAASVGVSAALRSWFQPSQSPDVQLRSAVFGLQCVNQRFLSLTADALACTGDESGDATALRLVDVQDVLQLPDEVRAVGFTHYVFALAERYFPSNATQALSEEQHLSAFLLASVLGAAVARSFLSSGPRNPLLRLATHVYATLFTLLDWLQPLALGFALPVALGAVLTQPDTQQLSLRVWLASALLCALQSLVLGPLLLWVFTRRHPFGWLLQVLPTLLHALVLASPVLPLAVATKSVLRSREVFPAVFGALFPVLAALNRLAEAVLLPLALLLAAHDSPCGRELSVNQGVTTLGFGLVAALGDTALPHARMALWLTVWQGVCAQQDASQAALASVAALFLQKRLCAVTNTATNLLLVRMAASTDEGRMYAHQFAL